MADDLGYGDLGCYSQAVIATPAIDRLAADGLRFTEHYAGHTVCRPSRLTLWTGRHTGNTPISGNSPYVFAPGDVTVARLLQQAGYATGGVGKWAMGGPGTTGHPNLNGFDFWFGFLDQGDAHNYYPTHLWRNDVQVALPGNVLMDHPQARGRVADPKHRVTYAHDRMTEEALNFIRRQVAANRRFLLHIHWTIPHANNEGGRVTGDGMEVPDYGPYADRDWPAPEKGFAAMIHRMDGDVARLVTLLGELGIDRQTLVLFSSDNGPHREGGHSETFFRSSGPLRGYKRDLYDGGIRVPLIAWWPGTVAAGAVTGHVSAFWDYLPTACELAGVEIPTGLDGISYVPTLLGQPERQKTHEYLFWKSGERGGGKMAVRMGRWKAVQVGADKPIELYDLATDPGESRDLASQQPSLVERAGEIMRRYPWQ